MHLSLGILIELEYKPCCVPKLCWDIMTEFMNKFMISPKIPHPHLQNNANQFMTPKDTIQQYNDQFNNLRKTTASSQNTSNLNLNQGINPTTLNLNSN